MATRPQENVLEHTHWKGPTTKSRILSSIYKRQHRHTLPLYPTVNPSYLHGNRATYRVDFRDGPNGSGTIQASIRLSTNIDDPDLTPIEWTMSDYRPPQITAIKQAQPDNPTTGPV